VLRVSDIGSGYHSLDLYVEVSPGGGQIVLRVVLNGEERGGLAEPPAEILLVPVHADDEGDGDHG
jgi:hypothetical protein